MSKELEERLKNLEKIEEVLTRNKALTNDQLQLEVDLARAQAEAASTLSDFTSRREAQIRLLESEIRLNAQNADEANKLIQGLREGNEALTEQNDLLNSLSPAAREIAKRFQELNQLSNAQNKYGKEQKQLLGDIAGSMGISTMASSGFLANIVKVGKSLKEGGEPAAAAFAENFRNVFNLTNLTLSVVTKIAEATAMLVREADKAGAALATATGTGRELSSVMVEAQDAGNLLGIRLDNAGAATGDLFAQTTNFVNVSKTAQASMVLQASLLGKLGINGQMASETFQFLNMNLGMTAAQAQNVAGELAMMGTELGITAEQMTSDFNQSLGTLAVYGPRSMQVFKGLASAAKLAGVEVSTLLGIAKKFDTFQGAAEGAAKFNALLGTQLSTTEMLMMTEDERIETLIRQTQAQGVAFKDMDKFSQMALASAAGIEDLNEAQRIFGMNMGQYQQYRSEMERSANAQNKLEEAVRGTMEIQDKFKVLAAEFAVMVTPILEGVHSALDGVISFLKQVGDDETRESFMKIVGTVGTLGIALKVIGPIISVIGGGFGTLTGIITGAGVAGGVATGGGLVAGIGALATAIAPLTPLLLGLGAAAAGLMALSSINFSANTAELDGVDAQLARLGASSEVMVQGRAVVDNLTRLSTGASAGMTAAAAAGSAVNVVAEIPNMFAGQSVKLVLANGKELDAYFAEVANG
jgi:hypothetical protein